ncbi:MAG TPA: exonuclease SbcCD subunit D [Candidatus Bathyarchaeia archaeon]|nr:exonuclease SbcCD subunit D [Candidatus Bathyarchaeia archaeon]
MIRFVHTADIHFGVENYGKIDPHTGIHSRLLDFAKAVDFCIDVAIEQQVDFFLFCGDAYKTHHPSQTQQKLLLKAFLRLYNAHIPVIIIVGNHDHPLSFGKANTLDLFQELPVNGFHVIAKPTSMVLETKSGPVSIVGIPWPARNTIAIAQKHFQKSSAELTDYIAKTVAHIIFAFAQKLDPQLPAVLAGHLTVSSGVFSGSEKRAIYGTDPLFLPSQLAIPPFDYVALGHLHRHQNLNANGHPAVVYSGSPERIDFGERKEEKGFCVVTIESKEKTAYEFIPTPTRSFIQFDITLNEHEGQTQQLISAISRHNIADAIIKIIYRIPAGKKDLVDINALQNACASAHCLAGVVPYIQRVQRERRTQLFDISMDVQDVIRTYLAAKPDLKDRVPELLQKTLQLMEQDDAT